MDLEERRDWLEGELGRKIDDPVWKELIDNRYARAGEMDDDDLEDLRRLAQSFLRSRQRNMPNFGSKRPRLSPPGQFSWMARTPDVRREVFAKCVANAAENHPDVLAFREEVLGDSFPLTYDQALRYVDEDGQVREEAPHARRLEDLTKMLARTFVWRAHDASWFVLCAYYTPPVRTFGVQSNVTRYGSGPEIGTITLTFEPWVPAKTVLGMYKKAQREMLGKQPHQVGKDRLRLLELVETMGEGLSWRERMNLWNELHPRQYDDRANFSKACREIRATVLEPGYSVAERDEEAEGENRRRSIKRKLTTAERELRIIRRVERAKQIARKVTGEASQRQ